MKCYTNIVFICCLVICSYVQAQKLESRWESKFQTFDSINGNAPLTKGILFTGSSSIRIWKNIRKDFNNTKILNRGFGGAQIIDLIENFDRIILQYYPEKIVIYCGDNDVHVGKSAEIIHEDFCTLYEMIRVNLPETEIYYISIKPSFKRWSKVLEMKKTNTMIKEYLKTKPNADFVDIFFPMIGLDGKPKKSLFIEDGLHLNADGYKLWTQILAPFIKN